MNHSEIKTLEQEPFYEAVCLLGFLRIEYISMAFRALHFIKSAIFEDHKFFFATAQRRFDKENHEEFLCEQVYGRGSRRACESCDSFEKILI